jgi:hypothetical protein
VKTADLNRRRFLEKIGKGVEFARVDLEFVTDDILQLMVYFEVTDEGMDQGAWMLALAVDAVAKKYDERCPPSFAAFSLSFGQARTMIEARPPRKRRVAAEIAQLPLFLGGSSEPD